MSDTHFVFAVVVVAAIMMASNRIRFDIVALLVVLALMVSGVLPVGEALAGFGSPVVVLVACLLVVGEMLDRTGVAAGIGDWILAKGGSSESRLLVMIMCSAGLLGAFMSSTAVVAIFIPVVLRVAAETRLDASRFLMPMSYAALVSGMLTLIATTPNLVVSDELADQGYTAFGFFSFTPVGLAVLVVAVVYVLLVGGRLLPRREQAQTGAAARRSMFELWDAYRVDRAVEPMRVDAGSTLVGQSLAEAALETRFGATVIGLSRGSGGREERMAAPTPQTRLRAGDVLLVVGQSGDHERMAREGLLAPSPGSRHERQRWLWTLGAATVLIHPESKLIGQTVREAEFRTEHGLEVLGVRRDREPMAEFRDVAFASADTLFVVGPWSRIRKLASLHHDFVVLETPAEQEDVVPAYRRRPVALAILAAMVLLSVLDVVPLVAAVVMAAMAAVMTRCLTMEGAYRSIHWSSLVLVAGMLPLADALEKTGGTDLVVEALMGAVGDAGPRVMLTVLFFLTAALGLFLSNTASAVLVAPIAIQAAEALGVSPYPFAIAVLIAASAAFVTPVSTPVVTLVVEPGRYGFLDFVKVGVPLLVLTYLTTLVVAPLMFPFASA